MNNFDRIAPVYDKLVRIVFGSAIRRAQTRFLAEIDEHSTVLILGGGTGWLLSELLSIRPDCKVTYIDASKKMIDIAKRKVGHSRNVLFIHGTERQIPRASLFEVVITHFYLDLFNERYCREVCGLIRSYCRPAGLWIACDFVDRAWWHQAMLKIMYTFFGLTSKLRTTRLPDWKAAIKDTGFGKLEAEYYSGNFICSSLYKLGTVNNT